MGGQSTTTQTQQSQTAPWQAAQPMLQGILSQIGTGLNNTGLTSAETGALNTLQSNAAQGNPYAGQIGDYAQSLLNGGGANAQAPNVQNNLSNLQSYLTPYANGSMVGNNPALAVGPGALSCRAHVREMVRIERSRVLPGSAHDRCALRQRLRVAWDRAAVVGGAGYLEAACVHRAR
jgi:hypothetical protein